MAEAEDTDTFHRGRIEDHQNGPRVLEGQRALDVTRIIASAGLRYGVWIVADVKDGTLELGPGVARERVPDGSDGWCVAELVHSVEDAKSGRTTGSDSFSRLP